MQLIITGLVSFFHTPFFAASSSKREASIVLSNKREFNAVEGMNSRSYDAVRCDQVIVPGLDEAQTNLNC